MGTPLADLSPASCLDHVNDIADFHDLPNLPRVSARWRGRLRGKLGGDVTRLGFLLALSSVCCAPNASPERGVCAPPQRLASTQSRARAAPAKASGARASCDYRVTSPPEPPYVVRVTARCEGGDVTGFAVTERELAPFVSTADGPSARPRTGWEAPIPAVVTAPGVVELTYTVDLDALASHADVVDTARRFGRSLLAPASSFLLRPTPEADEVPIVVHFESPGVESALRRSGDAFVIESQELRVATYTTFGAAATRDLPLGDATVRLVVLDGALDLSLDTLATWVTDAARGVANFYGRPPSPRTLVVLAPLPGLHGVAFGKMLPANAPGVIVLLGEHTSQKELHADWVLVHELFHVGTPSFVGEGKWYDEGLATYFEPLIRARLGWRTEADVWREFMREMPRGLDAMTRRGLEHPDRYPDMYWGGALFCLLADGRARSESGGVRGLEDGLRAVFEAGGVASEVWTLERTTEVTDRALGIPVLAELQARFRDQGAPLDLDALFRRFGVSRGKKGELRFNQDPARAALRGWLVYGGRPP
jgi:hypothetical protein